MYSRFPLSLERLPRPRGCCGCFSLRAGCLLAGVLSILYSVLALSVGLAALAQRGGAEEGASLRCAALVCTLALHATTLALSALMLVGTLTEKAWMIRPWVLVKALQLLGAALLFTVGAALHAADIDRAALPVVAAEFLSIMVWSYLLVVVSSHLRELEDTGAEMAALKADRDTWYTAL